MTPQPLPTDFVLSRTLLTWREAAWGYEHQWIDWSCLSELAVRRLSSESESPPAEVELAGMLKNESAGAGDLARKLAREEPAVPQETVQKKWLYLVLRWLFENRSRFSDPFAVVEEIFCEFGHPLEIATFVHYMPPADDYDPREHSKGQNETRMLENWFEYLVSAENQFGLKAASKV